ncbi:MAG: hypothetical protein RBJ76_26190 [Stenomitos frigidus ULC029]
MNASLEIGLGYFHYIVLQGQQYTSRSLVSRYLCSANNIQH